MFERIKEMLEGETSVSSIGLLAVLVIVTIVLLFLFYIIVRGCKNLEAMSGRKAYNLLKTIIIAAIPTLCGVIELLGFDINISHSIIWACVVGACVLVAVWNFLVYGLIGGIMFTVMHVVFGVVASFGVLSMVFMLIFIVAFFLFGGDIFSSGSSKGGAPSTVINVATNCRYHVTKGVNGESYIDVNGTSVILRPGAFEGRFIDDYGNEYM